MTTEISAALSAVKPLKLRRQRLMLAEIPLRQRNAGVETSSRRRRIALEDESGWEVLQRRRISQREDSLRVIEHAPTSSFRVLCLICGGVTRPMSRPTAFRHLKDRHECELPLFFGAAS